jgi:transposase
MASHIQHMQKALMLMNVQLHHVVSDITGVTGMKIIRAILDGNRSPKRLAQYRDVRCKESPDTICQALDGNYRSEHIFALRQALELYEFHRAKIDECDAEVESALRTLNDDRQPPVAPLPKVREKNRLTRPRNEPNFDVRAALYRFLGADLSQIHGFGPYTVLRLVAECGDDMSKWRTSKHFTSWLCLAPGNKWSFGLMRSSAR